MLAYEYARISSTNCFNHYTDNFVEHIYFNSAFKTNCNPAQKNSIISKGRSDLNVKRNTVGFVLKVNTKP
jgi:hypothetical protein